MPLALTGLPNAWAGIPLLHDGRLQGLVIILMLVLTQPTMMRRIMGRKGTI